MRQRMILYYNCLGLSLHALRLAAFRLTGCSNASFCCFRLKAYSCRVYWLLCSQLPTVCLCPFVFFHCWFDSQVMPLYFYLTSTLRFTVLNCSYFLSIASLNDLHTYYCYLHHSITCLRHTGCLARHGQRPSHETSLMQCLFELPRELPETIFCIHSVRLHAKHGYVFCFSVLGFLPIGLHRFYNCRQWRAKFPATAKQRIHKYLIRCILFLSNSYIYVVTCLTSNFMGNKTSIDFFIH